MGQVTSRVSDELEAALNRWAAETGVPRADLIRQILSEAADAHREGRASFEHPTLPDPADLQRLAVTLDQQTTELDRVLRRDAKRDADLARAARQDTIGVSEARQAIAADVAASVRGDLETVHGELVRTREAIGAALARDVAAVNTKMDQVLEAAAAPRVAKSYHVGLGDASAGIIATVIGLVVLLSISLFFGLAAVLPARWLAVPSANRLLGGGDQAICALVNYRYGVDRCVSRIDGKEVGVAITAETAKERRR